MLDRYKYENMEQMYAAVGFGANTANKVIARMLIEYRKYHQENNLEEEIEKLATEKQPQKSKQSQTINLPRGARGSALHGAFCWLLTDGLESGSVFCYNKACRHRPKALLRSIHRISGGRGAHAPAIGENE